eukprot:4703220-Amphidinium_carterae.1
MVNPQVHEKKNPVGALSISQVFSNTAAQKLDSSQKFDPRIFPGFRNTTKLMAFGTSRTLRPVTRVEVT